MRNRSALSDGSTSRGFTLVELAIVLVIAGILAALAAPSFNQFIEGQRVKNAATDIFLGLTRARSEALRLNENVTLAPTTAGTDWTVGWSIKDAGGNVIEGHEALRSLTATGPASVTFRSSGRTTNTADVTFSVTGSSGSSSQYVCLDLSGRPSITASSSC